MFYKPTSFHILEKENTENLITWNYPTISDELNTVLIKTCFSHGVEPCGLFYFKRLGKQWIYIKQFIVNNDNAVAVIVVSQCFQPKLYETLCDLFAAQYSRSRSGADLVKLYLQIYTKNGIYDNDDYISLNNFTWKTNLKGLIKSLGLETILIYNALLLKKHTLIYHPSVEDLQEGLGSITKLALMRKPEDLLLPLANSLVEIKEVSTYSLIGTTNKSLLHHRNIFDVFVDLESHSITLTDKARDDFQMSTLHKDFTRLRETRVTSRVYDEAAASQEELVSPDESVMSKDEEPSIRFAGRRKSVFAETYDPEEDDDDDDGAKLVYPKSDEQRQRLATAVKNILLFRSLDKDQMNDVLDAMFERVVKKDELVIKQGDDGDNFYVIQSGTFHVFVAPDPSKEPNHIHTYENSGSFGELALLYNMPRAATVKANSEGSLWAMDRQTFRRIVLKSAFKKRKMYEALIESVPMLKTLQPYERMNLADALVPRVFYDGDRIIKQGDAADGMYFVEQGEVAISVLDDSGKEVEINRISKGGYFGELALVTHRPRAASAYCDGEVRCAFLDVEAFERLLGPCMEIMKRNITDYEEQMLKIFGSKQNIRDIR